MSWIKLKHMAFYNIVISLSLLLIIDFFAGNYLLSCLNKPHLFFFQCSNIDDARISHPVYHHDLKKNYKGLKKWGEVEYLLCTDENGFKISCSSDSKSSKDFDIAFIGDSFTEGVGLDYEHTFVGQIAIKRPDLKVANLGVSSYSPSIYFSKVKYLLENGVTFKELVVYIDISDIQDEASSYFLLDDVVIFKKIFDPNQQTFYYRLKLFFNSAFPLTYKGLQNLKSLFFEKKNTQAAYLMERYSRSAWTYNFSLSGYEPLGVNGGIKQSLRTMTELSDLLASKGINLSVGVYPWPAQILYDKSMSEQVRIWKEFCEYRCVKFFNSFDSFFALKDKISAEKVIEKYFIEGDVHHNRYGAEIIANDFLKIY